MSIKLATTALVSLLALTACTSVTPTPAVAAPTSIHSMVTAAAQKHGIPVDFAHAVVKAESTYRCNAANGGSIGIMQVKPATARSVGVTGNLRNCATGLEAGMRYLKQAIKIAGGANCVAASLYNKGIYGSRTCTGYGRKIMRLAS